jgi:hypothetical protein
MRGKLKPYVRFDGTGRIVSSSLVYRQTKPLDGDWQILKVHTTTTTTTLAPTTTTTTTLP